MKRYLCSVQYVGKNYCGFQVQANGVSIQQKIEEALEKTFNQKIEVFASGRTDAGVNAYAQTLHFDADITIPAKKIPLAVNPNLPEDISFLDAKEVPMEFNARFDVKKKTYQYNMYVSSVRLPVKEYSYWLKTKPDINLMKECAKVLCGTHNFKAFMSAGGQTK
ncbi:MAG: tRNA pseudouridine synthase A, partial [Clostridia bacterium]|nr:tRNA pseudouridine synthase A [Clostridia bacterium]